MACAVQVRSTLIRIVAKTRKNKIAWHIHKSRVLVQLKRPPRVDDGAGTPNAKVMPVFRSGRARSDGPGACQFRPNESCNENGPRNQDRIPLRLRTEAGVGPCDPKPFRYIYIYILDLSRWIYHWTHKCLLFDSSSMSN